MVHKGDSSADSVASFSLFTASPTPKSIKVAQLYTDYDLLSILPEQKDKLLKHSDKEVEILLPGNAVRQQITVRVKEARLFLPSYPEQKLINQTAKFYRGTIKDDPESLVTLNVTPSGISGILADQTGHYIIQPYSENKQYALVFYEKNTTAIPDFNCHTSTEDYQKPVVSLHQKSMSGSDTVRVYFECDYEMYLNNNASTTQTTEYLLGLFNEVSAIYAAESITMLISDYHIWTTPDPYSDQSAAAALTSFHDILGSNFNGQLAHLMSASPNQNGGQAVLNTLCDKANAHSYSNIEGIYQTGGSYSWDVHAVSHELGHNLGSPHTHDCVWGPGQDVALDNCAVGGACNPGPDPVEGGTIMSYCHTTSFGVNFSLGFGEEPGDLIRSIVGSCPDMDGYLCDFAVELTGSGSYISMGPDFGHGASHISADHANWFRFEAPEAGLITIQSCDQGIDTRLFLYEGACQELTELMF